MYDIYIYELLNDYKYSSSKEEIYKKFCDMLWKVPNKRCVYLRRIKFKVLDFGTEDYKEVFKKYSSIPYFTYKKKIESDDSWILLRQVINNLYSQIFDKRVCTKIENLSFAKNSYYKYLAGCLNMTSNELENQIEKNLELAKKTYKINLSWNDYKTLINGYIRKCFENYIPLEHYENKLVTDIDFLTEENYAVRYISKSIRGYVYNYAKEHLGIPRKSSKDKRRYKVCEVCGKYYLSKVKDTRSTKCSACYKDYRKTYQRILMSKRRMLANQKY